MQTSSGKRLTRFESIKEIKQLSSFRNEIAAESASPREAIGVYDFPKIAQEKCGLSNCRTPHGKGYVVEMQSGECTLVGGYCGAKKMGLAFQEVINRARRADRISRHREVIQTFLSRASEFDTRINDFLDQPRGARWVTKRVADCNSVLPPEALHTIRRMASRNDGDVFDFTAMTRKEIEVAKETGAIPKGQPGPYFRREKVGRIEGLAIWQTELKTILIDDLQQGMLRLKRFDAGSETSDVVQRKHAQWVDDTGSKFAKIEQLIAAGQAFFAVNNIALLKRLSTAEREIAGLSEAIDRLIQMINKQNAIHRKGKA